MNWPHDIIYIWKWNRPQYYYRNSSDSDSCPRILVSSIVRIQQKYCFRICFLINSESNSMKIMKCPADLIIPWCMLHIILYQVRIWFSDCNWSSAMKIQKCNTIFMHSLMCVFNRNHGARACFSQVSMVS